MKVVEIDSIPLSYPLRNGDSYGNARGLVTARQCTLVKLKTESGMIGYGEAFGSPKIIHSLIEELREWFLSKQLFDYPTIASKLLNGFYHLASKGYLVCAISGIEMAAWDAMGKTLGMPVHKLLGGKARDTFMAYGSTGYITESNSLERLKEEVHLVESSGLQAIKIKVGTSLQEDIERVEIVRTLLPDIKIMVDINGNYTPDLAIQMIERLKPFELYWVEEPVPPHDLHGFRQIKHAEPGITLATGEAEYTRYGFRELIQEKLVDIVQPDLAKCGGIYEAKAISMMAQANNIRISPHVWGGVVGRSAALQLMASIPYYPHSLKEPEPMMFEYDLGENGLRDEIGTSPIQLENGTITLLDKIGLGVELDEEKVQHYCIS
ncbi:mandelate racemase/muconate lactonizing enzyme family protein [Salibacterium aidingense]|uniref:mandelate racemase/muconate lactonizing enzyme family protein n=1 Tax=Salibacterium aidingense TaxID=384933 RepID=UPI0004030B7A|nr:mandelate racemase/muconate lactonizing enzyme family protein [Salibacterium aidingense]